MSKVKGRVRQTRRLVDKSEAAEPGATWVPYRDGGATRHEQHIEVTPNDRVYQSLWTDGHLLTDFVLIQQVKVKGRWRDVTKIDCCHQEVHAHHLRSNGSKTRQVIIQVTRPDHLRTGLEKANELIFDRWKNNVRRWERGR